MGYEWLFARLAMVRVEGTQITPAGVTFTVASATVSGLSILWISVVPRPQQV